MSEPWTNNEHILCANCGYPRHHPGGIGCSEESDPATFDTHKERIRVWLIEHGWTR